MEYNYVWLRKKEISSFNSFNYHEEYNVGINHNLIDKLFGNRYLNR